MLPVHIIKKPKAQDPVVLPTDPLCYLIGSNGIFQRTSNPFYEVMKKLDSLPGLGTIDPKVKLHVRKLPYRFIREAGAFFSAVYKEHQSEAIVLLYCHPQHGWHMEAPPQSVSVSSLHVDYELKNLPTDVKGYLIGNNIEVEEDGKKVKKTVTRVSKEPNAETHEVILEEFNYSLFGTIHSHAAASAFHSSTDDKDEKQFDGLHITIGNVNTPNHSYSSRWVLAGDFYKAEMHQVAEDPPESFFDERWLKRVTRRTYSSATASGAGGSHRGTSSYPGSSSYPRRDSGEHLYRGCESNNPMDAEMSGWWPGGAAQDSTVTTEGGAAPSGGTFQGSSSAGTGQKTYTILPDGKKPGEGMGPDTPEKEARLRTLTGFLECKETKYQKNFFERLDPKWKDFLIQDLTTFHPLLAQSFLPGVGVVLQRNTSGGSDASSQHAAVKTESTTSPKDRSSGRSSTQKSPSQSKNSESSPCAEVTPPESKQSAIEDYMDGVYE